MSIDNASTVVTSIGAAYTRALEHAARNNRLRQRPSAKVWSPLEYAMHLRDVLLLFARRIQAILATTEPELEVVSHDDLVAAGEYNQFDPQVVAGQINDGAHQLAAILEKLAPADFGRRGFRDGEQRTILALAQRAAHESQHHLLDMARGLGD
ncbi:MAG TPA: DinB family protein [Candidatus Saccharimonadales bacterium]|nr:DinB family protein [Candidatus Saccharimonadales bacterium]